MGKVPQPRQRCIATTPYKSGHQHTHHPPHSTKGHAQCRCGQAAGQAQQPVCSNADTRPKWNTTAMRADIADAHTWGQDGHPCAASKGSIRPRPPHQAASQRSQYPATIKRITAHPCQAPQTFTWRLTSPRNRSCEPLDWCEPQPGCGQWYTEDPQMRLPAGTDT